MDIITKCDGSFYADYNIGKIAIIIREYKKKPTIAVLSEIITCSNSSELMALYKAFSCLNTA